MTAGGLTVWSTLEQWLHDGVRFGFITSDAADAVRRHSEDGRDRTIVEVGMRVRQAPHG